MEEDLIGRTGREFVDDVKKKKVIEEEEDEFFE